jgi:triacylglycerol esterase/lipase EstA (alpha/beta hydrolase family)
MISEEAMETQEQIETGYNIARLEKEDKRQVSSKNSNIYKTSNDITSKGYQHTQLIKPKQYAYSMFDYALGDHSINHFVSKEMFDSVNENKPIEINEINEIKEDVKIDNKIDNLNPIISPIEDVQPSSAIGYTVNNRELCKKYGSVYSSHCNKLLR